MSVRPRSFESGYLLHLHEPADGATRAWLFLLTDGFEPLGRMSQALADLAAVGQELAARGGWLLEERSAARIEEIFAEDSDAWRRGRAGDLREYTFADGSADRDRLRWHLETYLAGDEVSRIIPVTGAVARIGESLFGRQDARRELLGAIDTGPVMLLGPRRSGKTSLLQWLVDDPPPTRRAVYLDLERLADPATVAVELAYLLARDEVYSGKMAPVSQEYPALRDVPDEYDRARSWRTALHEQIADRWDECFRRLLAALGHDPSLLLLLDEFGDFLESLRGTEELQRFLDFVRSDLASSDPETCRVVVTGSRSLEYLIENLDVSESFAPFTRFPLPPFEPQAARRLLEERLRGQQIRPARAVTDRALELVGHQVPFYLQMLADSLLPRLEPGDFVDTGVVDEIYHEVLLGYPGQAHFDDLERRLKAYDEYRQRRAGQQALRLIAERQEIPDEELAYRLAASGVDRPRFDALMVLLEEYFFVERVDDRWRFRVPVLRDYALRYYPSSRL